MAHLRSLADDQLHGHPYGADEALCALYATKLAVSETELLPARGTTEMIWKVATVRRDKGVAVPLPAYTDHLRVATSRKHSYRCHSDGIDLAMAENGTVLISNPSNPLGTLLARDELAECARRHPTSLLVIDESYVEFCVEPESVTMVGQPLENLLVLRSPSKFYGIAAARAGVAWSRDAAVRAAIGGRRGSWVLSGIDAQVAHVALDDEDWARDARRATLEDAQVLEQRLMETGRRVWVGASTHFRLYAPPDPVKTAEKLLEHGVLVRLLGAEHGLDCNALRISAPRPQERERFFSELEHMR